MENLFFPGERKIRDFDSYRVDSSRCWRILEELWEHWRSKSEGAASRFRKSEIRTRGGWSDVIKLVTSRCVFNGPLLRVISQTKRVSISLIYPFPSNYFREFISEIGTWKRLERESLLPRFLQLLIKITTRFCSIPRFFDDDLTACNRSADLHSS